MRTERVNVSVGSCVFTLTGKNRMRAYTTQGACRPWKQQEAVFRARRPSPVINGFELDTPIYANNVIPLPPRDDNVHRLQAVSPRSQLSTSSTDSCSQPVVADSGIAMNSSSTDTTLVADVEDYTRVLGDDVVFLEDKVDSGLQLIPAPRLDNSVTSMASGSAHFGFHSDKSNDNRDIHHEVETAQRQGQLNVTCLPACGTFGNDDREPAVDSHTYVNTASREYENTGLCLTVRSLSQENILTQNSDSKVTTHCAGDATECVDSHTYVNTTQMSPQAVSQPNAEDHDYVNVQNKTRSLSQPLPGEQHSNDCHCPPHYVNVDHGHCNGGHRTACGCSQGSDSYRTRLSLPPRSGQAGHVIKSMGHVTKSAAQLTSLYEQTHHTMLSLPPKAVQSTVDGTETTGEGNPTHHSVYVNVTADQSQASQTMDGRAVVATSVCRSQSSETSVTCDHVYGNVMSQRSLSQPSSASVDKINLSLIPPRNIPRKNFFRRADEKSDERSLIPPSRSITDFQDRTSHPTPAGSPPHITTATPATLEVEDRLSTSDNVKPRLPPVYSVCSTEHHKKKDAEIANPVVNDTEDDRTGVNGHQTLSDNGALRNSESKYDDIELPGLRDGASSNVVIDRGLSDSVESLDIWPPVIPRHSELKFIVPTHGSKDLYKDSIAMVTNDSYVNVNP